ncbi:4Fe-4S dicluster domain-containing protein [Candidatus Bathyarchaeota archaeon]|nr:4Fe-4S dicluster domain-containing protein [Candidatus Bathyarchaeota archaeon]
MTEATTKVQEHLYRVDSAFSLDILKMHGGESFKLCYQCGTCTATCPIARFTEVFRPNKIMQMAKLGIRDVIKEDAVWLCSVCYNCVEKCPQGVEITDVIRVLKNKAALEGYVPSYFKSLADNILKTGLAYAIPSSRLTLRDARGLPPLPKTNFEDLKRLAEATHLSKSLGKG